MSATLRSSVAATILAAAFAAPALAQGSSDELKKCDKIGRASCRERVCQYV